MTANILSVFSLKSTIRAMKQMLNRNMATLYLFRFIVFLHLNIVIVYVKFLQQYFPDANVSLVFTESCSLNRFFKVKDVTLVDILSNIIYKFQCNSKTDRHFNVRKYEHLGTAYRTGSNITIGPRSAVMEHLLNHNHMVDYDNCSILYKCISSIETSIIESLLISKFTSFK